MPPPGQAHRCGDRARKANCAGDQTLLPTGSPPLVGRGAELAELAHLLAEARAGHGGIGLIAGEPGVGKTRLLLELAAVARSAGMLVCSGRAYESEGMPPFYPLSEALRDQVRTCPRDELARQLGPAGWDIALIVREVGERLPDLAPGPRLGPEQERFRLFDSLCDFLANVAGESPSGLLLCLDDLHWADTSTLLLVQHLARRIAQAPLLLVGAHRTVDLTSDHPLANLLGELSREQLYCRLLLSALSLGETADLVDRLTGAPAAAAVVQAVYDRTGGNPFYLGELVRHLHHAGHDLGDPTVATRNWGIPEGVRQVIRQRAARLSEQASQLLQIGAVLGDGFGFDLVEAMLAGAGAGLPSATSRLAALEEALLSGLIREQDQGYDFAHALVRQTVYESMSLPRRQHLHLQAADAIERAHPSGPDPFVADVAHHLLQAGRSAPLDRTITACLAAARRATQLYAWEESARFCELALEALDRSGIADPARRCDLLLALGEALLSARAPRRAAEELAPAALALAERLGDRDRASRACRLALDGLVRHGGAPTERSPEYLAWAERASQYSAPGSIEQIRADLAVANHRALTGQESEAWRLGSRSVTNARALGDQETLFRAAAQTLMWTKSTRHLAEMFALARETAEWSTEGVSPGTLGQALWYSALVQLEAGERTRFQELARTVAELAQRTGEPSLLWRPHVFRMIEDTLDGRLEAVLAEAERFVQTGQELGVAVMAAIQASMWSGRARLCLGPTDAIFDAPVASRTYVAARTAVASAHMSRGAEAQAAIRAAFDELGLGDPENEVGTNFIADILEAAVLIGDRAAAIRLAERVAPAAAQLHTCYFALTAISRHVGAAHALAGDREGAEAAYREALQVCERVRFRPEAALTHLGLAELLLPRPGSRSSSARPNPEAVEHLEFAIAELRAMGMEPALRRALALAATCLGSAAAKKLATSAGADPSGEGQDGGSPGGPMRRARHASGLTDRELEILRLLAVGKSSREISDELVLSVRTVERHISNIYLKLDVRTRAQATSYAHTHGLAAGR